jgi:hypothetical protein
VATGGTPQVLSKRKQLGVLTFSVILHRLNTRDAATGRACGVPSATCIRCGPTGAVEVTEAIRRTTLSG